MYASIEYYGLRAALVFVVVVVFDRREKSKLWKILLFVCQVSKMVRWKMGGGGGDLNEKRERERERKQSFFSSLRNTRDLYVLKKNIWRVKIDK